MDDERKVSWLELFYDLIFVVAISSTSHFLELLNKQPQHGFAIIGAYALMVIPTWWSWVGQTMFYNRYGLQIKQPLLFFGCQLLFTYLMTSSFSLEFNKTYPTFLIGYLGIRLITVIQYLVIYPRTDESERPSIRMLLYIFVGTLLITASSVIFTGALRYSVMYFGIVLDMMLPLIIGRHLKKTPVDLNHLTERVGLFVLIIFGEVVVNLIAILNHNPDDFSTILYGTLSFIACILMWSSYYNYYDENIHDNQESNGQVLLYSSIFILFSLTFFATAIKFGAIENLAFQYNNYMLYLSYGLFVLVKHASFVYHNHEKDWIDFFKKNCLLVILLIAGVIASNLFVFPFVYNIGFVVLLNILDLIVSRHYRH